MEYLQQTPKGQRSSHLSEAWNAPLNAELYIAWPRFGSLYTLWGIHHIPICFDKFGLY